ncbi:MAG: gamma-glutamyltransferase [Actinomycetota bacterium]
MRRVQLASATGLAAEAGAAVADAGGNAVDAAIGAAIASMCTEIGIIAPAGSGFVTIWPAEGDPVVIDGYAEMPGRGLPRERFGGGGTEIEMSYGGHTTTIVGWGSVATPGAFAAFAEAHRRYGAIEWASILKPTIAIVEQGFTVTGASAEYLDHSHRLIFGWDGTSRAITHHDDGTPVAEGDLIRIPHLADTLRLVAEEGAAVLYDGELGREMAAAVVGGGGILTEGDLSSYEVEIREPIRFELDEWEIAMNPIPAVGGTVASALLLLASSPPFGGWTPDETDRMVRIQRAVLRYRADRLDPYATRVEAARELLEHAYAGDLSAVGRSPSTVHTSSADTDGNACAITVSAGYGAGALVPGTGMYLNNSLGEVELTSEGFHTLTPGTRLVSNMAPTVAKRSDGSVLAIGSPGASRITTAVAQVLLNFIHCGMSLRDAVAHPRLHVEVFGGKPMIAHEPGLKVRSIDGMTARRFPDLAMYFGGVQAAVFDPIAGLYGAADPRRSGGTARGGFD